MTQDANTYQINVQQAGDRLDKLIARHFDWLSRAQVQALIKDGAVSVDGEHVKAGVKLKGGELITIALPVVEATPDEIEAQPIALDVVYEDEYLAVIDKPAGMVVHPGVGNEAGTLVHALLARYPEIEAMRDDPDAEGRMGIVHRLDKDTSGLIVTARQPEALYDLMVQFQNRTVSKTYLALLEKRPDTTSGRIDAPIGRDPKQRKRMSIQRDGRQAVTDFTVIDDQFRDGQALVQVTLLTGRTHQIRVHMAFIKCPVVGDAVYGYRKQRIKLKRHFLHAAQLSFDHPHTGERLTFESALPPGLQNVMDKLR